MEEDMNKKRARDDSEESDTNKHESKSARIDSLEAKRIQDDLLNIFDDSDHPDTEIQDLDSVIKSFQEEILVPFTSASSEPKPEIGFLLQASDDELGLPPSLDQKVGAGELKTEDGCETVSLDDTGGITFDGILDFDFGQDKDLLCDLVTLGTELFECFEPADVSEFTWPSESVSAL